VAAGLTGCATSHPEPLPRRTDLAAGLAGLDLNVTATGDPDPSRRIARPLTIDQIGLLVMFNNPHLKSERGTLDVARVALLQATLLPDPDRQSRLRAQLVAGPGTAASIAASLAQDIVALVTRGIPHQSCDAPSGHRRRRRAVARTAGRAEGARAGDRPLLGTARRSNC
jgi:hypothetical protein